MKKNVKRALFEETLYQLKKWQRLKQELGEWDMLVNSLYAKFSVLYDVIKKSGLEEEYQQWKAKQENITERG